MRRVLKVSLASALAAAALTAMVLPTAASAQYPQGQQSRPGQSPGQREQDDGSTSDRPRAPRIAPLRRSAAAGPCPYVKVLYDASRYVQFKDAKESAGQAGFTGEIQSIASGCAYKSDEPIRIQVEALFQLGRGPQAQGDKHVYRYWVAVTERNQTVLAKEYFDLPINFSAGQDRVYVTETVEQITIPRADAKVSGSNFEVLIGFDVTPEMAAFNREGKRFRVNAGQTAQNQTGQAAPAGTSTKQ